jgi:hypothetical protein
MTPVVSMTLAEILPQVPKGVIWQIATGINDTSAEFVTGVNDTMTPVANNGNNIRLLTT